MKNKIFLSILLFLLILQGWAQVNNRSALVGDWSGKLDNGAVSLTLILHLEQKEQWINVTMDSPDQGAKGIPAFKEYLTDDSIAIKFETLGANYRARLTDGKLVGAFTQFGFSLPLNLSRGVPEVRRPQNPQPPYPYITEEVTFQNAEAGATLAGTLTYPVGYNPKQQKKTKVVLLISGSGQQNRNEELMNHQPFLVIADFLARQGIATLRYDDRATGASVGGDLKNATTADFMLDAAAGMEFLRNRKFGRVGCLGHSEGGAIAFMLGAKEKTDFIVSLAGPGVKGDTLLAAQNNRILQLMKSPARGSVASIRSMAIRQQNAWMNFFIDYDPAKDIQAIRCPVFALNGDRDAQVISSLNLESIRRLLPKSPYNIIKEYPGLNHLFQHAETGLPTEYGNIEETISPEVLQDISQWINGLK